MPLRFLAIVVAGLLLLGGIGCSSGVDVSGAESTIKDGIINQTGTKVSEVTCPDDIELQEGGKFTCLAHAEDGSSAPIQAVQTDDDGNIHYSINLISQVKAQKKLEAVIGTQVEQGISIHCPMLMAAVKGQKYRCQASLDSGTRAVIELTATDNKGAFTYQAQSATTGPGSS